MKAHLEFASEEHLSKTWSKLLKTTERLSELEEVEIQIAVLQTDKESMKKSLDKNGEEISDLKLSEKKLEVENMALKRDMAELRKELEEVKCTADCSEEEISSLKLLVQAMQTKFNAMDVEQLESRTRKSREDIKGPRSLPKLTLAENEKTKHRYVFSNSIFFRDSRKARVNF